MFFTTVCQDMIC